MLSIDIRPKASEHIGPGHINMHFEDNWSRITKKVTKIFFESGANSQRENKIRNFKYFYYRKYLF